MNRLAMVIVVSLGGNLIGWSAVEQGSEIVPQRLTLERVLTEVESTNLSTFAAREGVAQAMEGIRHARSELLPHAKVVVGQSRNRSVTIGLDLESFGLSRQSDPFSYFSADLRVSQPLVDMAKIARYRESKHVAEISQFEYDAALEDIKLAAAEVFVASLRAREASDLAKAALDRSERLRVIAAERVEAGKNSPIDLSRARLEESNARQTVIEREAVVYQVDQQIRLFLNLDLLSPVELLPFEMDTSEELSRQPPVNFGDVLKQRSDYLAELREQDRARLLVRAADWQRLPSINVFGDYGYVTESAFDGDEKSDWSLGVSVSIPLFEGYRTRSEKVIAQSNLRATERRLLEIERKVRSEVLVAWENLRAAQQRLFVGTENIEFARETYQFALDRFREGQSDNRELIEAQLGLDSAETHLLDLRLQYVLTRLYFARACGSVEGILGGG